MSQNHAKFASKCDIFDINGFPVICEKSLQIKALYTTLDRFTAIELEILRRDEYVSIHF